MNKNIIFFDVETNGKIGSAVLSISAIKVSYDTENDVWEKKQIVFHLGKHNNYFGSSRDVFLIVSLIISITLFTAYP